VAYNVLVVEDTPDWRVHLIHYLIEDEEEYGIFEAETYESAIRLLREQPFDVVTVDLRLVDWDTTDEGGMELLEEIDEIRQRNGTQAIVITAYGTMERMRQAFKDHQVFDFIEKTCFNPWGFCETVRRAAEQAYRMRS
jgi:DNA-binding NtrC family response regulator